MKYIFYIGIGFILLCTQNLFGQTINEGIMVVSSDTDFSTLSEFDNKQEATFYNNGTAFFYSHFNNDGQVDFIENSGMNRFIGNSPQEISGNQPSYFYGVLFDNASQTAPFQLSGEIDVTDNAIFNQGIVNNLDYNGIFRFREEAIHTNTSDFSFVNGAVEYKGNFDFVFPVGKEEYYRPAKISAPENPDAQFLGEYFLENTDPIYPHQLTSDVVVAIDDQEYWEIFNIGEDPEEEMYVTLTWREETTPNYILNAAANETLTIVRWDEEANMWVDEGGTINKEEQSMTAQVKKAGVFTFATLDSELVLPCHVVVYNAVTANGDGINDYFRIEDQGDCAKELKVKVYNRWGVKVFESNDYGEHNEVFDGISTGRLTVKDNKDLPNGTYFYTLEYEYDAGEEFKKEQQAGYLYLSSH